MDTIRITKEFSFEMSHLLEGYDGPCSQIHGHSYRLFVTVKGKPETGPDNPKLGMVMDFGNLKAIIKRLITDRYDHSLVIRTSDTKHDLIRSLRSNLDRVITVDYQPTCENMVSHFARTIMAELPPHITLHSLRLHETATSFAEWFASDNL